MRSEAEDPAAEPLLSAAPHAQRYSPPESTTSPPPPSSPSRSSTMSGTTSWLALAAASGACAACNGVFAKLTTTDLTSSWSSTISTALGLTSTNKPIEFLIRATFFSLNLAFNALMWALFTAALTRATSTTRVSIINTSSNFMLTAFLGFVVFKESLPPLWWAGAALLVAGSVIIGRKVGEGNGGDGGEPAPGDGGGEGYKDGEQGEGRQGEGEAVEICGDQRDEGKRDERVKGGTVIEREVVR